MNTTVIASPRAALSIVPARMGRLPSWAVLNLFVFYYAYSLPCESMLTSFLFVLLTNIALVPIIFWRGLESKVDVFHPSVLLGLFLFLGFIIPVRPFLDEQDVFSNSFWSYQFHDRESALCVAMSVVILGALAFYLGCSLSIRRIQRLAAQNVRSSFVLRWNAHRMPVLLLGISALGLALYSIGVYMVGGFGALVAGLADRVEVFAGLSYFFQAIQLPLVASLIWWAHVLSSRRRPGVLPIAVSIFFFSFVLFTGHKSTIFSYLFALVAILHQLRLRIPLWIVVSSIPTVLILMTGYDLLFREYLVLGYLSSLDITSFLDFLDATFNRALGGQFFQIQILSIVVDAFPTSVSYQWGTSFLALFTAPIPSRLWPGKFISAPAIFTPLIWPKNVNLVSTTIPPGLLGELYMNFGWALVPFGLCLLGWVYGALYAKSMMRRDFSSVTAYALFAAMLPQYLRGDSFTPTILFIVYLAPLAFLSVFGSYRAPVVVLQSHSAGR